MPVPQVNAQDACVLPGPWALDCYYGQTTPDAPVSFPPSWCSAIHNNHWFAFTADATSATFSISCFGCAQGNGIQAAVLSTADCINFQFVSPCLGNIPTQTTQTLTASPLVPGEVYYLCIDGSGGALCDYAINGSVPTVNGPTTGMCLPSTANGTYTTATPSTWSINPLGAGSFVGPNTGNSVNIHWEQPGPAQVCAQNINCPNAPLFCLDLNIGEDVSTQEDVYMCQSYNVSCAGQTFTTPGSHIVNLPTYLNCDSLVNCFVHLIPTVYTTEHVYMCQGQSVTCADQEFYGPGIFPVKLQAWQGCDSVVNCNVHIIPTTVSPYTTVTMCGPAEYYLCTTPLTSSGLYTEICTSWQGCDSILNVNLAILEPQAVIAPPAIIDCDVNATITLNGSGSSVNTAIGGVTLYQWSGPGIVGFNNQPTVQVNQPGTYCLIVTHSRAGFACKDTACVQVQAYSAVPQLPQIVGNNNPCGDSTLIYVATSQGSPPPSSFTWSTPGNIAYTTIAPDSIQITWNPYPSGNICVTANNSCGPSAPACLPVTVQQPLLTPQLAGPTQVCANGGSYTFTIDTLQPGTNYTWNVPAGAVMTGSGDTITVNFQNAVSGNVCIQAQNICGAGAPVCQSVQVNPTPAAGLAGTAQLCNGASTDLSFSLSGNGPFDVVWSDGTQNFTLNNITSGHTVSVNPTQTTTYHLLNVTDNSAPACAAPATDSVTVTVWQHFSASPAIQLCEGQSVFLAGAQQTTTGVYVDNFQTIHGCDSIITTSLTVYDIDSLQFDLTTCDPAAAGTTIQQLTQFNGCDSVVVTNVTLLPSNTTLIDDKSCDPASVGVFTQNLTNQYGCDSTVITTVTYSLSDTTYLSASNCDPAATGTFTQNFLTSEGCDSLVITTVSLLPSNTTNLSASSCNPAQVGVFTNVLSNYYGCDSTVITTVNFFHLDTTQVAAFNCDPAAVGTFFQTLVTTAGCDSVIQTNVSLLPSNTTNLSASSCNPSDIGVFTNVLSNQFGCDSTVITTVNFFHLDTTLLAATTCDPAATGIFFQTLVTSDGCDSVLRTTVSLLPSNTTNLSATSCNPADVGVFTNVLSNQYGCDSTVITTVTLLPSNTTAIQSATCDPSGVGIFTYNLTNQYGCDSIVTETVTLLPSNTTNLAYTTCDVSQVGTITTVLSNQYGCDSTVVAVTSLLPLANCSVTATMSGSTIPCGSNTGSVTVTPTLGIPPFDYTVLQNGNPVATGSINAVGTPDIVTGLAPGNYTLNIGSANGYSTNSQATIVQLFPPALTAATASDFHGYAISCAGELDGSATASTAGGLAPFNFIWSNGGTTQQIQNLGAGSYSVTVTDANNCTNTATVTLTEPNSLFFNFSVNDLDCFGQHDGAITVEAAGGVPPYRYAINGSTPQSSSTFLSLTSGSFTVTTSDANDCQRDEVIIVNAAVPLEVELGNSQTIKTGDSTEITAIVNIPIDSILSVAWTPPFDNSECPECLTQTVAPFVSTVYSVKVEALNGCTDEDKVTVFVDRRRYVYVPNAFTPGSNGDNSKFTIFARPGTVANIRSIQIFDRWGESVYSNEDFQPNDPTVGWDGNHNGKPMTPAVFAWVMVVEFTDGVVELFEGDVTLVR